MAHFLMMFIILCGIGYMLFGAYMMEEDARISKEWAGACVENITRVKGVVEDADMDGVVVVFETGVREKYPETSLNKIPCE